MSTFDGDVVEFPDIKIDHFRRDRLRPTVAFFLSHVHSDHLQGLESFKGSFIYCSLATKVILLRLEKYPHRMNFARGILEARAQSYAHLKSILKPIPLETPTMIELSPGRSIRVTLFDANHCVGAVMFLIEGDGKAILYTGDIRSEAWWVDSLARNSILIPFVRRESHTPLRRLDNVYLDTTFARKVDRYRDFPSKASGILELLTKVSRYPAGTRFYFDSWTFGYEEVWQALSNHLNTQVHVDEYRYKLYLSLADATDAHGRPPQAFQLIGSTCGNHYQEGCLITKSTCLHSCEQGAGCEIWNQDFVRITPIVSRYGDTNVPEVGAGGGQGDWRPRHTLEVEDPATTELLKAMCSTHLSGDPHLLDRVTRMIDTVMSGSVKHFELDDPGLIQRLPGSESIGLADDEDVPIARVVPAVAKQILESDTVKNSDLPTSNDGALPRQIVFPYSRHSSYSELCLLIETFWPRDIYPCTVDKNNWNSTHSMSNLFGHLYDEGHLFKHDMVMQRPNKRLLSTSTGGNIDPSMKKRSNPTAGTPDLARNCCIDTESSDLQLHQPANRSSSDGLTHSLTGEAQSRPGGSEARIQSKQVPPCEHETGVPLSAISLNPEPVEQPGYGKAKERMAIRQDAYKSALGAGSCWFDITLTSVHGHKKEDEL